MRGPASQATSLFAGALNLMGNPDGEEGAPERVPDVFAFLEELADTVRTRLAPEAPGGYLNAELNSLASILRIVAQEGPGLEGATDRDRRDLADVLRRLGHPPDARIDHIALRRRLVDVMRAGLNDQAHEAVLDYVRRDLQRGLPGLLPATDRRQPTRPQNQPATRPTGPDLRARIEQALTALPDLGPLRAVERATEGYGADTVVCTTGTAERRIVLRIQWPQLPLTAMLQPVGAQATVLTALAERTLPVPPVLGTLAEDGPLGAPALVTGHVDGFVPTTWTPDGRAFTERLANHAWRGFVADLARLHAIPWQQSGVCPEPADGDAVSRQRARVQRWVTIYRESELVPDPLIEEVLSRLLDGIPAITDATLIHGDYRPGNIIYGDDLSVRAIIDWDGVAISDYHEDLGHLLAWPWRDRSGLACGLASDDALLDEYSRISGRDIDRTALAYYKLQSTFRRYLGFVALARSWFDRGGDVRMARAWLALANDRQELGRLLDLS